jgi:hypothetical protein
MQVKLYAEYATLRLIDFLRASQYYNLEMVCAASDTFFVSLFIHMGSIPGIQYMQRARPCPGNGLPVGPYGE